MRNGKLDDYGIDGFGNGIKPNVTDADGYLPPLTTSAQAEGAIEGVHSDYRLVHAYDTDFKFSRYSRAARAPPAVTKKVSSGVTEYDLRKREL